MIVMTDINNTINVPQPGSPRFESDTAKAIGRIRASLGGEGRPYFETLTLGGLTASRLVYGDSNQILQSVADLTTWVAGTADEVTVADDGDGTITISLADPLIVGKGGTGAATLTDHSILLGSGTSAVTALGVATDGQIPIGSTGADPVLATITGTADVISVTNGAGSITLDLDGSIGDIAALTPTDSNFIVGDGTNWVAESGDTARTSLGLGTGDTPQFSGTTFELSGEDLFVDIMPDGATAIDCTNNRNSNGNTDSSFNFYRSRGTPASPAVVQDGDWAAKWRFYGHNGSSYDQYGGFLYDMYDVSDTEGRFVFYAYSGGANYIAEFGPEYSRIGDTDGTGYVEVSSTTGDLVFHGAAGIPFGTMYNDTGNTVTVSVANTWYEVTTGFSGGNTSLVPFGNGHQLTVTHAGMYEVVVNASLEGTVAGDKIGVAPAINGTAQSNGHGHSTIGNASDQVGVGMSTILDLSANDEVSVAIINHTAARDLDVIHASLTLKMVGGT